MTKKGIDVICVNKLHIKKSGRVEIGEDAIVAVSYKRLIEELERIYDKYKAHGAKPYLKVKLGCGNEIIFENKEDIKNQNYKCDCGCGRYFIKIDPNLK